MFFYQIIMITNMKVLNNVKANDNSSKFKQRNERISLLKTKQMPIGLSVSNPAMNDEIWKFVKD